MKTFKSLPTALLFGAATLMFSGSAFSQEQVLVTFEGDLATELGLLDQTVLPLPYDLASSVCDQIIDGACTAEGSTDDLLAFLEETQDDADGDDETNSASAFAPGQLKEEGESAREYAPGQVKEEGESAREHAPGQQGRD